GQVFGAPRLFLVGGRKEFKYGYQASVRPMQDFNVAFTRFVKKNQGYGHRFQRRDACGCSWKTGTLCCRFFRYGDVRQYQFLYWRIEFDQVDPFADSRIKGVRQRVSNRFAPVIDEAKVEVRPGRRILQVWVHSGKRTRHDTPLSQS